MIRTFFAKSVFVLAFCSLTACTGLEPWWKDDFIWFDSTNSSPETRPRYHAEQTRHYIEVPQVPEGWEPPMRNAAMQQNIPVSSEPLPWRDDWRAQPMGSMNSGYPNLSSVPPVPPEIPGYQFDAAKLELRADQRQAESMMQSDWGNAQPPMPALQPMHSALQPVSKPPSWMGRDFSPAAGNAMSMPLVPPMSSYDGYYGAPQNRMQAIEDERARDLPWQDARRKIEPSMNNYAWNMERSAPYTSGQPYNPYGYQNYGLWNWYYMNPQWETANSYYPSQAWNAPQKQTQSAYNTYVYQPRYNSGQAMAVTPSVQTAVPHGKQVSTIYFDNDSTQLGSQEKQVLKELVEWFKDHRGVLRIVGHSSARTKDMPASRHEMEKYRISLDRAESVAKYLKSLGVPPQHVVVQARGDKDQVYAETMPTGESWNRRVEIFWQRM